MDMTQSPLQTAANFDFGKEAKVAGAGAGATSWTPSDNAMASNQLSKLLQSDSKLMQQARSKASAASARRGLMNSSIGVEAGESAAIQSAVPIASQDASTYAQSEQFNASAANDFARDANAFGRNAALTKYQGILAQESQGRDMAWRSGESALDRQFQGGQSQLARDFQANQSVLDRDWRTGEAGKEREFNAGQSQLTRDFDASQKGLDREWQATQNKLNQQFQMDFEKFRLPMNMMANFTDKMQSFVSQVMADPNMDAAAKDQAIKNYYSYSQQTMGWMSTFFGQKTPDMATGGVFNPAVAGTGNAVTNTSGTTPNIQAPVNVGVPGATPAPATQSGANGNVEQIGAGIPEFSGMTAREIYSSGNAELIRRYEESLR